MNPRPREVMAVAAVTLVCMLLSAWCSSNKLLWYDELQTVAIASLGSIGQFWRSSVAGFDLNPVPVYLATHSSLSTFGDSHISARLPENLAAAFGAVAFYLFLRRRFTHASALPGLCLYWTTGVFEYSFEARPYAFLLCGAAILFLGVQRTVDREKPWSPWLLSITLGLWIALGFHVTGLLAAAVAAPALAFAAWQRRRFDAPLAIAFLLGLLPAIQYPPIYRAGSTLAFLHSLLNVSPATLIAAYVNAARFAFLVPPLFLCVCVVGGLAKLWSIDWRFSELRRLPAAEWILAAGTLLVPLAFALASSVLHKPFSPRYAILAAWGFALVSTALLSALSTKSRSLYWISAALCLAGPLVSAAHALHRDMRNAAAFQRSIGTLQQVPGSADIAISNGEVFLQLNHYAPPPLLSRIVYLESREQSLRWLGTDTVNAAFTNGLPFLRPRARVVPYREFTQRPNVFWVFECPPDWFSWQSAALRRDGYTLQTPADVPNPCIRLATPPARN